MPHAGKTEGAWPCAMRIWQAQLADPAVYGDAERLKTVNRELKELELRWQRPTGPTGRRRRTEPRREELLRDPELRELAQEELAAAQGGDGAAARRS